MNPAAAAVYFLMTAGIAMFSMNPVILSLSLAGSLIYFFLRGSSDSLKSHLYLLLLFIIMAVINPLVNHNGATVLFVMNDNPITLEALVYGTAASAMIISVVYWFRSFTAIMTSDKLLYIFGRLSPKLALILSMALRFVPMFSRQIKKTEQTQKAMGLYKEDNIADSIKGKTSIFSIIITWGLENGIITADSMTARGYGCGKRSGFSVFRWRKSDTLFLIITALLFSLTIYGLYNVTFSYYPYIKFSEHGIFAVAGYAAYGILVLLPSFLEAKEALRWKYLKSKI